MVWLATLLPYGKAAEVAQEIGGHQVSDSTIWEMVQRAAERTQSALNPVTTQKVGGAACMGVSLDGCMVNVRGEEWKELKLGVVFSVSTGNFRGPDGIKVNCTDASYVAHLGGPEGLSNQLAAEVY